MSCPLTGSTPAAAGGSRLGSVFWAAPWPLRRPGISLATVLGRAQERGFPPPACGAAGLPGRAVLPGSALPACRPGAPRGHGWLRKAGSFPSRGQAPSSARGLPCGEGVQAHQAPGTPPGSPGPRAACPPSPGLPAGGSPRGAAPPGGVTWSGPRLLPPPANMVPPAFVLPPALRSTAPMLRKMAAPEAAWNRLDVPWPVSSATVALAAEHPAVRWLPALRRRCDIAGKRLSGTGLAAEGRVLRAVLYVYHSRLLRHRSYLALQQVEQCLKRLWKMNLVGCIDTLAGLIPKKNTSQAHAECLVPSQPMLETVALKVLGGCKLILRLLDRCCKAFLLSVKHLCSEEFILLNTVSSGLLSRLWIQYRCVLQSLVSLYGILSTSLHLVSETQQMPYIKGFTFPSDITNFLGVNVSSEVKKQKARMITTKKNTSWLKKLFPTMPEAVSELGEKRNFATCTSAVKKRSIPCPVDIGEPVLVTRASRGKHLGFDIKSLLRPSRTPAQEGISIASTPFKAKSASLSSRIAKSQHAESLIQMVQTATSFGELSEALRKAILWCKGNKFKSEAYFLRNKLLKSNRLHHVEAQGCSLKKKLCCVKTSVRKYLLYGSQNRCWPKQYLRARFCRRRIKSSACLKRTLKTVQQKPSELFGVCENSTSLILRAYPDGPPSWEGHSSADTGCVKLSTAGTPKQLLLEGSPGPVWKEATENMDIDSIFAAMGV